MAVNSVRHGFLTFSSMIHIFVYLKCKTSVYMYFTRFGISELAFYGELVCKITIVEKKACVLKLCKMILKDS